MTAPLDGFRVLDFGQGGAGPYCGQLLGDFGADVIKVEPPRGDWGRTMGAKDVNLGFSGTYASMNRNKRSVCLDLTKETAREVAKELASESDVVIESFRPGAMERLGLGYEDIAAIQDRIIYCSVSAFGQTGPLAGKPGSDSVMQPYGGLTAINGNPGQPPLRLGNIVSDMLAAMNAFSGVLLALQQQVHQPGPRHVQVSLLDSIIAFQTSCFSEYLFTGEPPVQPGNRHPLLPTSGIIQTSDGHLTMAVLDHYWSEFCRAIGRLDLLEDPRFATADARQEHRVPLWDELETTFALRTTREWLELLESLQILSGPVNDYPAVVSDPQVAHNGILSSVARADGRSIPMVRAPISITGIDQRMAFPPALGEHTDAVLTEVLAYHSSRIAELRRDGSIGGPAAPENP